MNISLLADAALPVGFIAPDVVPPFHYFAKGTCFLVEFDARVWVITAAHVLRNMRADAENMRVPLHVGTMETLPLETVWDHASRAPDDDTFADLTIFRVSASVPRHAMAPRIALGEFASATEWTSGDDLRVFGFPACLDNAINYEDMGVGRERYHAGAEYVGSTTSRYIHQIRFEKAPRVNSLDGMSGSPVFSSPRGANRWSFAGMLVRGSHCVSESAEPYGYFIEARAIVGSLSMASRASNATP